jgi:hypothetical protein
MSLLFHDVSTVVVSSNNIEAVLRRARAFGLPAIATRSAAINVTPHAIAIALRARSRERFAPKVITFILLPPIVGPRACGVSNDFLHLVDPQP